MRFLHLADLHLGFQQYGNPERGQDFARALKIAVDAGVADGVDALVIAGDLFHRATIDPAVYIQAADIFKVTRERGIPVIAVEGNHDAARHRGEVSWLDVLCSEGYLHLLRTGFDSEGCHLERWDPQTKTGAYLDFGGVRFIGLQWSGAMAPQRIPEVAAAIRALPKEGIHFTVLITHAALEGELPNLPAFLNFEDLDPLKDCVDYLAMGHIHKRYERRHWVHNPGCPEVYDMGEMEWLKGWYEVTVTADRQKRVDYKDYAHRPFFTQTVRVDGRASPAELYQHVETSSQKWRRTWEQSELKPVVILKLEGCLEFERRALDPNQLKKLVQATGAVLLCEVREDKLRLPGMETVEEEDLSQADLELRVFQEVAFGHPQYAPHAEAWARTMQQVMALSLEKKSFDDIFETLQAQMDRAEEEEKNMLSQSRKERQENP